MQAAVAVIARVDPDVLLLTGFDFDLGLVALSALADNLHDAGASYPHLYASAPNTGLQTGHDLDGDGRLGEPEDAQGYGEFAGQSGMALLSRLPIDLAETRDFAPVLWQDLPGATLPQTGGIAFYPEPVAASLRLSPVGHWDVALVLPDGGRLRLLAFDHGTPAFDGPERRNDLRNRDELRFWSQYLDRAAAPFVLAGDANLDPSDGDGFVDAMAGFLSDPRLQDPRPASRGGALAALHQGGVNPGQTGDPALDTVDWDDGPGKPGNLRVDYVLPSAGLTVADAGVFWPAPGEPLAGSVGADEAAASRHALVWVDIALP